MSSSLPIYLTNTLGHQLERFQPLEPGLVRMYSCGPTVYSYIHIGNLRAYVVADTLRRMLEYNGYKVIHVRNITDVGHLTDETLNTGLDRIERAARSQNMTPYDLVDHITDVFIDDARLLNLEEPQAAPRATEYIGPMIDLTRCLVDKGYGYPVEDGNVFYDVSRFPAYGALSGNTVAELVEGGRVEVGDGKRSPADFALWRAAEPDKLMRWDSPWGEGVPGWHIECSAMSMALLGEQIDIHTGGIDNMFPHHENEIAQSEAATGKKFVRYWLHNQWLFVEGEKMSKSIGNVFTVADLIRRGFSPLAYRYFTFQAHYRTPLNFTWEALEAAQRALTRLWELAAELYQSAAVEEIGEDTRAFQSRFHEAINRDLDMPGALAVLHDVAGSKLLPGQKLALFADFDRVLALDLLPSAQKLSQVTQEQRALLERRAAARAGRDWSTSDALRAELAATGLDVKDTPGGQRWVRRDLLPGPGDDAERAPSYQSEQQS